MKKILGLGAAALAIPAAIASAGLFSLGVASSEPANVSGLNVVGEPYGRAVVILKSQSVKATFGGSFGSDMPQAECIVDSQKVIASGKMILLLDCTQKAADNATDSQPARPAGAPAAGAPGPGNGQGTYGGQIGVPTAVGPQPGA